MPHATVTATAPMAMAAVHRLTRQLSDEKAEIFAKQAVDAFNAGELEEASRKLRAAAALGHDNEHVQAALLKLHDSQTDAPLLALCRRYALYHDEKAGVQAVDYLRNHASSPVGGTVSVDCFKLVLQTEASQLSSSQDTIIAELCRQSFEVRMYFASQLVTLTTEFFENIYDRGDDAANCLRTMVLDVPLWPNEEARLRVKDDLFQLLLAKLMESGHDLDGRALRGIALLLMTDAPRLHHFIDEHSFDSLLSSLDLRLPADVRGQATLVISKYLEFQEQAGQAFFSSFINDNVARRNCDNLIEAFSAAASLFPVATAMTASLFLADGLLQSLMPLLEGKLNAKPVHDAFLALLSAACIDQACRAAISKHSAAWLSHKVSNGDEEQSAMAAKVLAKLRAGTNTNSLSTSQRFAPPNDDSEELVTIFKNALSLNKSQSMPDAVEGLAYSSLKADVKEDLVNDKVFLKSLLHALATSSEKPEVVVGGLSILTNLTQYSPTLSDEQKKMSQLHAYANAAPVSEPNVLDNDEHVEARCSLLMDAGVIPTLVTLNKGNSVAAKQLTDKIMLSLSRNPKDRGKIAQQGGVKLMISHSPRSYKKHHSDTEPPLEAAHALARILISLNPSHVFPANNTPHITDAVEPLHSLLKPPDAGGMHDQPRDLLPVFESLLALTNLASSPDIAASRSIIRLAWAEIEDLLLSSNIMVQRAACELVCNLTAFETGAAKFADGSHRATQRLHLLLALADHDDVATRRAAGGALAMLSEHDAAIKGMLEVKRGPAILLELCQDDSPEIVHRGLVCVRNVANAPGDLGERGRQALKEANGLGILQSCLKIILEPGILQIGVDALKPLVE